MTKRDPGNVASQNNESLLIAIILSIVDRTWNFFCWRFHVHAKNPAECNGGEQMENLAVARKLGRRIREARAPVDSSMRTLSDGLQMCCGATIGTKNLHEYK